MAERQLVSRPRRGCFEVRVKLLRKETLAGDIWGGLASMLVALPASIAFGVAVYSPLGPSGASQGALAGILGATAIGLVAPVFGGTDRLISAPCAPAAAVMGALAVELTAGSSQHQGVSPERALVLMTLVALLSAGLQMLYGAIRGGTLIKYIPYPVVTGYLSGVGVVIFLKQLPSLLGLPKGGHLWEGIRAPGLWEWHGVAVGLVTITVMLLAPRVTKAVPAAILGLLGGVVTYFSLGLAAPALLTLDANHLVIGRLGGGGGSFGEAFVARFAGLGGVRFADLSLILMPALTLSVLLSIDTLKTCVVVDALTRSRHDSNREIIGQGLANMASTLIGGMPGAGTSGATLVNIASGGQTRLSSVFEGLMVLVAYLLLGGLVAWAPIAALAGILIVVAYRMFDWTSVRLLRQRSTVLDFFVVAAVVAVAVGVGLITASGVGVGLAIILFIRDQIRGSVIHRKTYGNQVFSKQRRLPEEIAILEKNGAQTVVVELEGNLFFGTTDQLFTELAADLKTRKYVILDLRRVRSVDLTAVHMLEQIEAQLSERGGSLLFASVPKSLPTGQDLATYFDEVGLVTPTSHAKIFNQLSDALEWAEDRVLAEAGHSQTGEETTLELSDIDFLRGRKPETIARLASHVEPRSYAAGDKIFKQGDSTDEIYFIRRGTVRIALQLEYGKEFHVATFGQGDFFGDMAFLDRGARSADAIATTRAELFVLSRERFEKLAEEHPRLGAQFFAGLARSLAIRLRHADGEIRALEEA
jgi:sulfate permease, SulP family